jgi:hypothetical protein
MLKKTKIKHPEFDWVVVFYELDGEVSINIKINPIVQGQLTQIQNWLHGVYKAIADVTGVEFEKALSFSPIYCEVWKYIPSQEPEFIKEERFNNIP